MADLPERAGREGDSLPEHHLLTATWRTGRKVGRTIYAQLGVEPADDDPLIGVMDTPELAWSVVFDHNTVLVGL